MATTLRWTNELTTSLLCWRCVTAIPWYWCSWLTDRPSSSITESTCFTVGNTDVAVASDSSALRFMISYFLRVLSTACTCLTMSTSLVFWLTKESSRAGSRMSAYMADFSNTEAFAMRLLFPSRVALSFCLLVSAMTFWMCAKYNPLLSTKAFMACNLWSIHRVPLDLEGLTFLFSKLYCSFRISCKLLSSLSRFPELW